MDGSVDKNLFVNMRNECNNRDVFLGLREKWFLSRI